MMGGVSPKTCWAFKKHWNNKFYYTVASCWFFLWDLYYDARIHKHQVSRLDHCKQWAPTAPFADSFNFVFYLDKILGNSWEPGSLLCRETSYWLRHLGDWIPTRTKDFLFPKTVQTGSTAHQASYANNIADFPSVLTLRRLMSYIYGAPILDVSRSHTTTQHSR